MATTPDSATDNFNADLLERHFDNQITALKQDTKWKTAPMPSCYGYDNEAFKVVVNGHASDRDKLRVQERFKRAGWGGAVIFNSDEHEECKGLVILFLLHPK
jgi:hypothetical protein